MRILFLTLLLWLPFPPTITPAQEKKQTEDQPAELPYRISKETTHITGPLTKDGRVDYAAYLNQQLSKGVTPENNAAVLYWKAIGDRKRETYGDEYYENLVKLLGTNPFEDGEPYLVGLDEFIERKQKAGLENAEEVITAKLEEAQSAPWTGEDNPLMAEWLKLNEKPLKLVLAGTRRSHYCRPLGKANRLEDLLTLSSPDLYAYRDFARLLTVRTTFGLGEKRPEAAIRNLLALHRLANQLRSGHLVIQHMLAVSLNVEASEVGSVLVNSGLANAEQLAGYLAELRKLSRVAESPHLLRMQQWECLDVTQTAILSETDDSINDDDGTYLYHILSVDFGVKGANRIIQLLVETGIDWDAAFLEINRYYDQAEKALTADGFEHRHQQLEALREQLDKKTDEIVSPIALPLAKIMTPQERGKRIGALLADGGFPLGFLYELNVESRTRSDLTLLGIALAAHQKLTGGFPESLDALVLKYLSEMPNDPYTGEPFVYRVDDEGAIVYSLGKNLKDDGGRTFEEDYENHDLVFQIKRTASK